MFYWPRLQLRSHHVIRLEVGGGLQELQDDDPRQIGRYALLARLGSGGMGQVFLGRSPGGRLVAVKVVHPELASDHEFRVRFAREVEAARRVSGAFTAPVIDADLDVRLPWLVTSYVSGPSLADAVDGHGPLPLSSVLALAAGLAEGLGAVHEAGVIHRDLKPSNVLLAQDGPRLIDFGISQAADFSHMTLAGMVIGTPGFMSPEQALGDPVGPPGDIFGLGAVLAFAATGEGPYGDGPAAARQFRVLTLSPRLGNLPGELRPLLARCMARDPMERPTASQFLADLLAAYPSAASTTDWLPTSIHPATVSSPLQSSSPAMAPDAVASPSPALTSGAAAPHTPVLPSASLTPAERPAWDSTLTAAAPPSRREGRAAVGEEAAVRQEREPGKRASPQKRRRALLIPITLAVAVIGTTAGLAASLPGHRAITAGQGRAVSLPSATITVTTPHPPQSSSQPAATATAEWSYGVTASQVAAITSQHDTRITQIRVMDPSVPTFAMTMVSNSGASASAWWWYYGQTASQVNALLVRNNAELVSIDPYQTTAGLRFAVVMVPSADTQGRTWWWYYGISATTMGQLLSRNNARLVALRPYLQGGNSVFAVIMTANAGADYIPWEYLCHVSVSTIVSRLNSEHMRVDALAPDPAGGWDAILVASQGAEWYWWYGISAQAVQNNVASHGTQLTDLSPYYVNGQLEFTAVELKANEPG
jgi:serine/threonine protein kinase